MAHLTFKAPAELSFGFDAIRAELDIAKTFPVAVLDEADRTPLLDVFRRDATALPFIAIDPPGSTDLDQAFYAAPRGAGYRVHYTIADVASFVRPGSAIDLEARNRGVTLYSPDQRSPLHPARLSEDRASLLPNGERPALVWTIDLDSDGIPVNANLERAMVRVREAISYQEAQARIDGGPGTAGWNESLELLRTIGRLRQAREADRGGVSLNLPAQEVVKTTDGYTLEFDTALPVEGWNAQISLLTGIVAGTTMADTGVGILRTLPTPTEDALRTLRHQARALEINWPRDLSYADFIRGVVPDSPQSAAFMLKAARSLRGAGYVGFNGAVPSHPEHGAIASIYSHVTAPLRRLVDRFGNEILLAIYGDTEPPAWALEALDDLPSIMGRARSKESALDREVLGLAEAAVLEPHVGSNFEAFVVDLNERREHAVIQIREPAVVAEIPIAGRELAERVLVRLERVDILHRAVDFKVVAK